MFSKRAVALKTLIQPKKEATQVQTKQNFEEARDDGEEIGPVENRPPPEMVLPHMPKVRVKIADILQIVRILGGVPNMDRIIVYEQEMSKSMTKERRNSGLKRSLSSSSTKEEEEDPYQPGTSHSIGKKKKPKRSGQQNKPSVDMKPKKKEIQLDKHNFSPVLNGTIPNIDLDVTNTSSRGRGHYSTIDSTDTDKDDFISIGKRIQLVIKNCQELFTKDTFSVRSTPIELVGFEWSLEATTKEKGFLGLFLHAKPLDSFIGNYQIEVDRRFSISNALPDKNLIMGRIGQVYTINERTSWGFSKMAKLEDLLNPNKTFLTSDGDIEIWVDFTIKSSTLDHLTGGETHKSEYPLICLLLLFGINK